MVVTLQGNPANNGVLRKDPHAGCNPATKTAFSKKTDIVRKRDFHKDKSLFLCQYQLIIVYLQTILDWRVVRYHQSYWTQCLETDLFNMVVSLRYPCKRAGCPPVL